MVYFDHQAWSSDAYGGPAEPKTYGLPDGFGLRPAMPIVTLSRYIGTMRRWNFPAEYKRVASLITFRRNTGMRISECFISPEPRTGLAVPLLQLYLSNTLIEIFLPDPGSR
jgi:hypothetical protein